MPHFEQARTKCCHHWQSARTEAAGEDGAGAALEALAAGAVEEEAGAHSSSSSRVMPVAAVCDSLELFCLSVVFAAYCRLQQLRPSGVVLCEKFERVSANARYASYI